MTAMETAVCMGMDAFRLCIGQKPRNFTAKEVLRWLKIMIAQGQHNGERE